MKRFVVKFALPAVAALTVATAVSVTASQPVNGEITVTGMVVDLACKFAEVAQSGPAHIPCAEMCARAGVPFGILTADGKLYVPAKHGENPNPALLPFMEQEVTVTGEAFPAAGSYVIQIATIQKKV